MLATWEQHPQTEDHAAAGDEKPAALTNGSATAKFTPKPRVGGAVEEENGFDVNQDRCN